MSLKDIINTIDREAQEKISEIKKDAEEKKRLLVSQWEEKISRAKEEILKTAEKKSHDRILQAQFKIQSQKQREILKKKQEIINSAFAAAEKKLSQMDERAYEDFMKKLLSAIPETAGEIIAAKNLPQQKLLKNALEKSKKRFTLTEKTADISGGFIFFSKEIEIDNSFKNLVENQKESALPMVASLVFSESKA